MWVDLDGSAAVGVPGLTGRPIVEKFELIAGGGLGAFHPVAAAKEIVGDLAGGRSGGVADHLELPRHDLMAVDEAGVVSGSFTAPAAGLNLDFGANVGQFKQACRGREELSLEAGEQPERVDIHPEFVDHPGELFTLSRIVELGFVAYHCVDMAIGGHALSHEVEQVGGRVDDLGIGRHPKTARHLTFASVELSGENGGEPAGPQVVVDLQDLSGLSRAHCPEGESQFSHWADCTRISWLVPRPGVIAPAHHWVALAVMMCRGQSCLRTPAPGDPVAMPHHDLEAVDADSPVRSITSFDPLHADTGDDALAIARRLHEARCGALLVDDPDGETGIVTERDLVRALAGGAIDTPAGELMTRDLIVVPGDMSIADAALTMHEAGVRHLAVDRGDGVLGITSIRDLIEPLLDTIDD